MEKSFEAARREERKDARKITDDPRWAIEGWGYGQRGRSSKGRKNGI